MIPHISRGRALVAPRRTANACSPFFGGRADVAVSRGGAVNVARWTPLDVGCVDDGGGAEVRFVARKDAKTQSCTVANDDSRPTSVEGSRRGKPRRVLVGRPARPTRDTITPAPRG